MGRLMRAILAGIGFKRKARIIVVIPARIGSSRLPGKVLLPINGKPLVWHVAEACRRAGFKSDDIYIAVDYELTKNSLTKHGLNAIITNPFLPSGTDRVLEACKKMHLSDDTVVLNIQGDEPELDPMLIGQLAKATNAGGADIFTMKTVITKSDDKTNINVVKVIMGNDNRALYFTRAHAPFVRNTVDSFNYYRHVGIYGYTVKTLKKFSKLPTSILERTEGLEQLRALENGMTIKAITAGVEPKHGVDTQQDYDEAVLRMGKRNAN